MPGRSGKLLNLAVHYRERLAVSAHHFARIVDRHRVRAGSQKRGARCRSKWFRAPDRPSYVVPTTVPESLIPYA